jgi:hypothetical protein
VGSPFGCQERHQLPDFGRLTRRPSGIATATWAGGKVDHRTYSGRDHVGVVTADSALIPDLMR